MNDPLHILKEIDSTFHETIGKNRQMALSEGALPVKTKLLIAMAIDVIKSAENGVRTLAQNAIEAGATKQEIAEVLRIAYFLGGVGAAYTSANALKDIL